VKFAVLTFLGVKLTKKFTNDTVQPLPVSISGIFFITPKRNSVPTKVA
jgi:hypothetical protein